MPLSSLPGLLQRHPAVSQESKHWLIKHWVIDRDLWCWSNTILFKPVLNIPGKYLLKPHQLREKRSGSNVRARAGLKLWVRAQRWVAAWNVNRKVISFQASVGTDHLPLMLIQIEIYWVNFHHFLFVFSVKISFFYFDRYFVQTRLKTSHSVKCLENMWLV